MRDLRCATAVLQYSWEQSTLCIVPLYLFPALICTALSVLCQAYCLCVVWHSVADATSLALEFRSMAASSTTPRVLLAGAGPTAAVIWHLLRGGAEAVTVIDKARGVGGRMSTSRARSVGSDGARPRADLGAQYITSTDAITKSLVDSGVLQPLTAPLAGQREAQATQENWVAPAGMSAVVKALLQGTARSRTLPVSSVTHTPLCCSQARNRCCSTT